MRVKQAVGVLGVLLALGLGTAHAESVLLTDTSLVSGSESSVFSFETPGAGTVSVQLTNLDWPQPLYSLSFLAATPTHVMASWADPGSPTGVNLTFQVPSGGRYFADVMAQAGGSLDLGVYSMCIKFTPSTPTVALPASGVLLLTGILAMLALRARARRQGLDTGALAPG